MNEGKTTVWLDNDQHKKIKKMTLFDSVPENKIEELIHNLLNEAILARKGNKHELQSK